jgi:urease accessory protein
VSATMLAYPADAAHVAAVREVIAGAEPNVAATLVDDLLVIRALARDVLSLRPLLDSSWRALRQPLLGRPAHVPRIWNT